MGFSGYDEAQLARLDAQAIAMLGIFAARAYARVEPAILQPADSFLDRSGEEMRRRTYVLSDPMGRELCLRPDLTIPVCRLHLESAGTFPVRLSYHGLAFRMQQGEPQRSEQFWQTGLEYLGAKNRADADGEVLGLAIGALGAAGLKEFFVRIGDVALFVHLVDGLDLAPQWRARLKRHFWRRDYFSALRRRLACAGKNDEASKFTGLFAALEALDDDVVLAGRTLEDISQRLREKAAEEEARPDPASVKLIEKILAVAGPAKSSLARIGHLAKGAGIDLTAPLAAMEARLGVLATLGVKPGRILFAANFGRNMEYYTGLVFELWSRDAEGPVQVAGGGRYDNLLKALGTKRDVPAIGCALRGERVLAARAKTGAL